MDIHTYIILYVSIYAWHMHNHILSDLYGLTLKREWTGPSYDGFLAVGTESPSVLEHRKQI